MNWSDITVFQWQQLCELFTNKYDEVDMMVKSAAICHNMTENQIDSLPLQKFNKLLTEISFIHKEIKPEPALFITVNGKRYRCIFDIRKLPAARYIESKYYNTDVNNNLHKIAASMVMPQKKTFWGWKDDTYDAGQHSVYAEDMLQAPAVNVLGSVVFFCKVYLRWIKSSKDYLIKEMMKTMNQTQAELVYQTLCSNMDGFIKPNWLQDMKA